MLNMHPPVATLLVLLRDSVAHALHLTFRQCKTSRDETPVGNVVIGNGVSSHKFVQKKRHSGAGEL